MQNWHVHFTIICLHAESVLRCVRSDEMCYCGTNMEIGSAVAGDPSNHHIGAHHAPVGGQSEPHPSRGVHHHVEGDRLPNVIEGPLQLIERLTRSLIASQSGGEREGAKYEREKRCPHQCQPPHREAESCLIM